MGLLWTEAACSEDEVLKGTSRVDGGEGGSGGTSGQVAGSGNDGGNVADGGNLADASTGMDDSGLSQCNAPGDECTACINQFCCDELTACGDDVLCLDIVGCVIRCEQGENGLQVDSELCRAICGAEDPAFQPSGANALAYVDCRLGSCSDPCVEDLRDDAGVSAL